MKCFTTPNSKNINATLRMITIEKSELAFLLILYFRGMLHDFKNMSFHYHLAYKYVLFILTNLLFCSLALIDHFNCSKYVLVF